MHCIAGTLGPAEEPLVSLRQMAWTSFLPVIKTEKCFAPGSREARIINPALVECSNQVSKVNIPFDLNGMTSDLCCLPL